MWRRLSIENYCQLTSHALKQLGIFESETQKFLTKGDFSPYVEELGQKFLAQLQSHELDLVSCLATFELALIDVQNGIRESTTISWNYDPYIVLNAVLDGKNLRALQPSGEYETRVDRKLPRLFEVSQANC